MIRYKQHSQFIRQLKKLLRKYPTLHEDLLIAQVAAIELLHLHKLDNNSVEVIPGFSNEKVKVYKIKKFACQSFKGKGVKSGIRVIYAFYPEIMVIEYLEIYYKEHTNTNMNYDFVKKYFCENKNN